MSNKGRHQELISKISALSSKLDTMDDKLDQLLIASSKLDSILKALQQPTEPVPMQQVEKPLAYQTQSGTLQS